MSSHPALDAVRVGCVQYLNSKPLIYGWDGPVHFDHPSSLARDLARGALDVALVPVYELFARPGYRIVDGVSISSFGPVLERLPRVPGRVAGCEIRRARPRVPHLFAPRPVPARRIPRPYSRLQHQLLRPRRRETPHRKPGASISETRMAPRTATSTLARSGRYEPACRLSSPSGSSGRDCRTPRPSPKAFGASSATASRT